MVFSKKSSVDEDHLSSRKTLLALEPGILSRTSIYLPRSYSVEWSREQGTSLHSGRHLNSLGLAILQNSRSSHVGHHLGLELPELLLFVVFLDRWSLPLDCKFR